jgi:hypothetical protein
VRLWFVLVLAGCNALLGLDKVELRADATIGVCTPIAHDPHRYLQISDANGLSWQSARDACRRDGYDIAVLDKGDTDELANETSHAVPPSWLGVSYNGTAWQAIDGCDPELDWAANEPNGEHVGDCLQVIAGGMRSANCNDTTTDSVNIKVLCETPRPSETCRMQALQRDYEVVAGAFDRDTAIAECAMRGKHVVEIDSTDELDYLLTNIASSLGAFWIGVTEGGSGWTSPTSCPAIFAWTPNFPGTTGMCVIYRNGGMETTDCSTSGGMYALICEAN